MVQQAIDNLIKNSQQTVILVAHRLSTVRDADMNIVCVPIFVFYAKAIFSFINFSRGCTRGRRTLVETGVQTEPLVEYGLMTVPELQSELQKLGRSTTGRKAELVARLRKA